MRSGREMIPAMYTAARPLTTGRAGGGNATSRLHTCIPRTATAGVELAPIMLVPPDGRLELKALRRSMTGIALPLRQEPSRTRELSKRRRRFIGEPRD